MRPPLLFLLKVGRRPRRATRHGFGPVSVSVFHARNQPWALKRKGFMTTIHRGSDHLQKAGGTGWDNGWEAGIQEARPQKRPGQEPLTDTAHTVGPS